MVDFNAKKINKYIQEYMDKQFKNGAKKVLVTSFTNNAILFAFDKNKDGKVTKKEFEQLSKEKYSLFAKELSEYNKSQNKDEHVYSYDELSKFFEDGYLDAKDLDNGIDVYKAIGDETFEEKKDFKHPSQMSEDEIQNELKNFSWTEDDYDLSELRRTRNLLDKNSKVIDWHVGTFNQGTFGTCTILATVNGMPDEDLKKLYAQKSDKEGNIYYEVNFPQDNGKKPIKVTQEELENHAIKYKRKEFFGFSPGDADVSLIEMAYVKRYGSDILFSGEQPAIVLQRITGNKDAKAYYLNITEDMLINDKVKTIGIANDNQLKQNKNFKDNKLVLSSGETVRLEHSNSDNVENVGDQRLILPDGTVLYDRHSYSVKSYDPKTKELTIVNPHESSTEIKIPFEVLQLLELCE